MEAVQNYLHEYVTNPIDHYVLIVPRLAQTRKFSDFTFKVDGGQDHKVHKVVLAAQSRVFEKFFEKHESEANLTELFSFNNLTAPIDTHKYSNIAMREAMIDVLAYCYYGKYHLNRERDVSDDFALRVLSHLLVHEAAVQFQIPDLVTLSAIRFRSEFWGYCTSCTPEGAQTVFKSCFSSKIMSKFLHDTAIDIFRITIDAYKKENKFKEALELMGAVPMATAKLYSQPPKQEEVVPEDGEDLSEEDESEDEDEVSELEESTTKKAKKEAYVTG
ncbi:hypothetical protein HBH98_078550 [Parastagonospora nodorum]|nr:hypothetical protein HBH51_084830 [Parastagonospora nodorum]KAH4001344.1 hypothetical protein HBI10_089760 [Parastagonospora nodorum]KAH4027417.1 hypothetical protein HBI13_058780 [Parastagonospora nodorum]KAH4122408.1 hypothetical protein HBH47_087730 [Parastagonospora nodorum]KAH4179215.1 hypothetical protein HBH43_014310 [Parastagonospora nodorum]